MDIPKIYDPKKVEEKWYRFWEEKGYFSASPDPVLKGQKKKFVVMMPPPNVTGIIHMGHVIDNTLQDILVRWRRMQGYETLWQPGIDHAGIATQNVVEKELAREGKTRFDLGREEFIRRVWEWKEKYGNTILQQLRKLGVSAHWGRTKFTLDPDMYRAVMEAFVRLYSEGLIYKGTRIINWCPRCGTALADDEVEHEPEKGHLWYIKYPLEDGSGYITVATTRPETYLGDTAVAVNPDDERYRDLIGKRVRLPLVDWTRKSFAPGGEGSDVGPSIPVIADPLVDLEFGTGAVKVTPAHDPADYEIGVKHGLPAVVVMDPKAVMNENAGPYKGLDRFEARKKIVEDLEKAGFIEKIEDHEHNVGHCYRCHTVIEPYISEQWFVRMRPLADKAMDAVKSGEVSIIPDFWKKVYFHWLENVRDWCISRQIWWGHRIPVYYCEDCGEITVSVEKPEKCPRCGSSRMRQDEDVLDTWFSSWLWPISTLGWPEDTDWLRAFYPGDVLVTGWDILFFWVARMIMSGTHFMGKAPFKYVYLHGLVRDEKRRKLSKSLGNSPDPLDLIERYGADGVRMGMMLITPEGRDILFSEKKMELGRNFANKIWNASRFLLLNAEGMEKGELPDDLELEDRWILQGLDNTISDVLRYMESFDFNSAAWELYDFFWHEFCNWYLESIKPRIKELSDKKKALNVAFYVLEKYLRLLHPFMPFITEEIWQNLPNKEGDALIIADYPEPQGFSYSEDRRRFDLLRELITELRDVRASFNVPKGEKISLYMKDESGEVADFILSKRQLLAFLAGVEEVRVGGDPPGESAAIIVENHEFYVPLGGLIDVRKELDRIQRELAELKSLIDKTRRKLENPAFLEKAPKEVIQKEKEKLEKFREKARKLELNASRLST